MKSYQAIKWSVYKSWIYDKLFTKEDKKVRNHDYITEKERVSA